MLTAQVHKRRRSPPPWSTPCSAPPLKSVSLTLTREQVALCSLLLTLSFASLGLFGIHLPWPSVFEWLFRLLGLALLGPHMYLVGKRYRAKKAAALARAREFDAADVATRRRILGEHKDRMLLEARRKLDHVINGADAFQAARQESAEQDGPDHGEAATDGVSTDNGGNHRRWRRTMVTNYGNGMQQYYALCIRPQPVQHNGELRFRFEPEP